MSTVMQAPQFTLEQAKFAAREIYGLSVLAAAGLPSERDQNYLLEVENKKKFVLKIANASESLDILNLQNQAMRHLGDSSGRLICPAVYPTRQGELLGKITDATGVSYAARLVSFIDGIPLARIKPQTDDLLSNIGQFLARLVSGLKTFSHPAARRDFIWDLQTGQQTVRRYTYLVRDEMQKSLVEHFLAQFEKSAQPKLSTLETSIIHNDGNDYNIIVSYPDTRPETFGERQTPFPRALKRRRVKS